LLILFHKKAPLKLSNTLNMLIYSLSTINFLMVDLGSWSVLLSRSQVRFSLVLILVGKEFCSGLELAPTSGRWNWSPWISRSLDRIPSFQKKKTISFL